MLSVAILCGAALACAIGLLIFVLLAIKWRNEDWVFYLVIGAFACAGGAAWCTQEAVKKAEVYEQLQLRLDEKPR